MLHRVEKSRSFPSAHVFPGGNLSAFHEGRDRIPGPADPARHVDGPAYRLAAIRETFEETGILLARVRGSSGEQQPGPLLDVPEAEKQRGRKAIHAEQVRFEDWLASLGGVADTGTVLLPTC